MRNSVLLSSLLVAGATACAARAPHTLATATYSCGDDRQIVRRDRAVFSTHESKRIAMGWRDDEGAHYVEWPRRTTTMEALEYVIPNDGRADAIERIYDTSGGSSRVDWRMKTKTACAVTGAATDAIADTGDATGSSRTRVLV
jgi:hypothetical protein